MSCTDCTTAAQVEHHGFTNGCRQCVGRGLGRIFLAKGERGRRLRQACEQFDITVDEVRAAHQADAMHKDAST